MLNTAKETKMQILSSLQTADQALTNLFFKHVIDMGGAVGEPFLFAFEAVFQNHVVLVEISSANSRKDFIKRTFVFCQNKLHIIKEIQTST